MSGGGCLGVVGLQAVGQQATALTLHGGVRLAEAQSLPVGRARRIQR